MTKRLTIALVALVALVLVAVMPASATFYSTNSTINAGATVYYGEQGLNITHALNQANNLPGYNADAAPTNTTVGWWASAAQITSTSPTYTATVSDYKNVYILPSTFPATGTWYLLDQNGNVVIKTGTTPAAVFTLQDPSLAVVIWDADQKLNVNGQSIIQGENLTIRVDNNLYSAINNGGLRTSNNGTDNAVNYKRADGNANDTQKYMDIKVKTDSGNTLTALYSTPAVTSDN
ncbi:MAG: DUF3821 domain-containing protein, partial [Methanoregula sp.]